nr:hypothetical protein Iba_chr01cCG3210 [Ipomoea batatas]
MSRGLAVATRGGSDGLQILSVDWWWRQPEVEGEADCRSITYLFHCYCFSTTNFHNSPPSTVSRLLRPPASTIGDNTVKRHILLHYPRFLVLLVSTSLSSGANTLASLPVSAPSQSLADDLTLISRFSPNLNLAGCLVVTMAVR